MKLNQTVLRPFALRAISLRGWLAKQLRIQADGLSGHLDEFWPEIKDSAWIGGQMEGWEWMPYWLDGVIPLAWLLNDTALKDRINGHAGYILEHQNADGWLGPSIEAKPDSADVWSQILAMKMLVGYHAATDDRRSPGAIEKALRKLDRHIEANPLSRWGQFRWFEALAAIWWLYERNPEPWLLDLAVKLQAQGFHWKDFFARWPLTEPTPACGVNLAGRWNFAGHVVDNAMALKAYALWWRLTGDATDREAVYDMIGKLDRFHGTPTGVFTGDECLAGTSPIQGTELCAVVEYMYSLEVLLAILGDPSHGDRLEKIAFNALPAALSPDMWAHQYDQQVNQIECSIRENRAWTTNGPDSNLFGLAPHCGCCAANFSQGWPKLAAHLWMRTADDGIAAAAYAPSRLDAEVSGVPVSVELETEYPFRETLSFKVTAKRPVSFPLLLRIPSWTKGATLDMDGSSPDIRDAGTFHRIEREWQAETRLTLRLPMSPRLSRRPGNAVSISRGPLVYALKVGEDWRQVNQDKPFRAAPHADWEVYPTTPWNYALEIDETTLLKDVVFQEHPLGDRAFSPDGAPISAVVKGRRVPEWGSRNGSAMPAPASPAQTAEPEEKLTLIPYGCAKLRITEFPVVKTRREHFKT